VDLSERIAWLLTHKGWSQRDLAKEAGLSPNYISLLVKGARGGTRGLTLATAKKIANAAGVDVQWVLEGVGEPVPGVGTGPVPHALAQALALLEGRIAPQVRMALQAEVPHPEWSVREWLDRGLELQAMYDSLPQDLSKSVNRSG
jgi:transcriptional regulator with XRE-family HTH domain